MVYKSYFLIVKIEKINTILNVIADLSIIKAENFINIGKYI